MCECLSVCEAKCSCAETDEAKCEVVAKETIESDPPSDSILKVVDT